MVRSWSAILGAGLIILWIVELGAPGYGGTNAGNINVTAVRWITWLDLLGAFFAFATSAGITAYADRATRVTSPVLLAIGLFALWLVGLSTTTPGWITWWNFGFACAFLLTGIAGAYEKSEGTFGFGPRYMGGYGYDRPWSYGPTNYGGSPQVGWERLYDREQAKRTGTRGYQRTDLRISEDVNDRLSDSWEIDASDIEVKVNDGVVTLDGSVATRRERRIAEAITESVLGVRDVHNQLTVRAETPAGKTTRPRAA